MAKDNLTADIANALKRMPEITKHIAVTAADEFDQNWRRQGFFNRAWKPSKRQQTEGGSTLLKTGDLRRSLRYTVNGERIIFHSDRVDAQIHNEGGTVHPRVTAKMRAFAFAQAKATGNDKWKGLALTKKTQLDITIPQRQFVGEHPMLDDAIEKTITNFLNSIL